MNPAGSTPIAARGSDDRDELRGFLDAQRQAVLDGVADLTPEQLRRRGVVGWSCLGLIQHLAAAERYWFGVIMDGRPVPESDDPEAEWTVPEHVAVESVLAEYRGEIARSDDVIGRWPLAAPPQFLSPVWLDWDPGAETADLGWIILHMIAETARHVGQLELARQAITGSAGRELR